MSSDTVEGARPAGVVTAPTHVALIGCGFTGTSALFQLVDRYPVKRITVFEASGVYGPGFPYQTDECPHYLINNTTDTMCLTPDNNKAFINWLRDTGAAGAVEDKGHLPRALFGEFLVDVVRTTRRVAAVKGIALEFIPAEATALKEVGATVEVSYEGGKATVDAVLLTTGRCPELRRFNGGTGTGDASAKIFPTHVSSSQLDTIATDATIYVIGTSLSAYDIVNRLFAPESGCAFERQEDGSLSYSPGSNHRRVILGSRSGRLKKMQSRKPLEVHRRHFALAEFRRLAGESGGLSLEVLASLIRAEAEEHSAVIDWASIATPYAGCRDGESLNARAGEILTHDIAAARDGSSANFLVDMFADAQLDMWDGFAERLMTPEAEKRYRAEMETAFLTIGAPCPVPTAERLLALHKAGVLTVRAGMKPPMRTDERDGFSIAHRFGEDQADVVIDASGGLNRAVDDASQSRLVCSLVQSGLMRSYEVAGEKMPGADIDMETFRLHGARNLYALNMWLWGPGFFTSSAALMATFVKRTLDHLFYE